MVFRRRHKRPFWRVLVEFFWPRGGWSRAAQYVRHRVRRLPDTPEKIARGIWAGVFVSFTPLYGLHFVLALIVSRLLRGNLVAALLATFIGNPLTYVPIAAVSLQTGYLILGIRPRDGFEERLGAKFAAAWNDLKHNIAALFSDEVANWASILRFYDEVFFPYLIGGILPGIVAATLSYYLSLQLIQAHQNRRRKILEARLSKLKKPADEG